MTPLLLILPSSTLRRFPLKFFLFTPFFSDFLLFFLSPSCTQFFLIFVLFQADCFSGAIRNILASGFFFLQIRRRLMRLLSPVLSPPRAFPPRLGRSSVPHACSLFLFGPLRSSLGETGFPVIFFPWFSMINSLLFSVLSCVCLRIENLFSDYADLPALA